MTEKRYHILDRKIALTASELRGSLRDTPLEDREVVLMETAYPNKNVTIEFMAGDTPEDYPDDPIVDRNGNTSPFSIGESAWLSNTYEIELSEGYYEIVGIRRSDHDSDWLVQVKGRTQWLYAARFLNHRMPVLPAPFYVSPRKYFPKAAGEILKDALDARAKSLREEDHD